MIPNPLKVIPNIKSEEILMSLFVPVSFHGSSCGCLCFPVPLRYNTVTIIWICLALVMGLVTFLAIIICRKRQEEYFELSAFSFSNL